MGARFALTWLFSMVERHSVRCGDVAVSKWKAVLLAELCDENIESSCRPAVKVAGRSCGCQPMRPSHRFDDLAEVELCSEFYSGYCRNGGICKITADIFHREIPVCSCMPGFRGKQCELVNDADMYYSGQLAQFERITLSTVVVSVMIIACVVSVSLYLYKRYINYGSNLSRNFTRSPTFICQVYPRRTGVWGGFLWRRQMQHYHIHTSRFEELYFNCPMQGGQSAYCSVTSVRQSIHHPPLFYLSEGSGRCVDAELLLAHSRNISTEEAVALRSEPHAWSKLRDQCSQVHRGPLC